MMATEMGSGNSPRRSHYQASEDERRRSRRLAPGVISICLLMIFGTFVFVVLPLPVVASNPVKAGPDCIPCPYPHQDQCVPNCPGGTPPTITGVHVATQTANSLTRQTWVNWSRSGTPPLTTGFSWNAAGGGSLPVPQLGGGGTTVNLNALTAGTTYDFTISVSNAYGQAYSNGQFTTLNAPTTGFAGWVYSQATNPYWLDPNGAPVSSASIGIDAMCYPGGSAAHVYFSAGTTDSSGHYISTFPLSATGGGGLVAYSLSSTGVCTENGYYPFSNSQYTLVAGKSGYWNATRTVPSSLTATNDYQPFAVPSNSLENVPVGLSLIHTVSNGVNKYNAQCGFTFYDGSSQSTVDQTVYSLTSDFFGLSGQTSTTEGTSNGAQYSSPGSWGNVTGLDLGYYFSGFVWGSNLTPANGYIVSSPQGFSDVPYKTTDWLSAPSPLPAKMPSGYQYAVASSTHPISNPISFTVFSGGTYSSVSQDQIQFGLPLQWNGVTATPSLGFSDSTTVNTQSGYSESCSFAYATDPSQAGGQPYFYYFNDDSGTASAVVHVWLEGWCDGSGEQTCPGGL